MDPCLCRIVAAHAVLPAQAAEHTHAAFAQRRKTLRAALASWAGSPACAEEILVEAGVSPQARGEKLGIYEFIAIADAARRFSKPVGGAD